MLRMIAPDIQPVRHGLALQQARQLHVLVQADIPFARSQNNFHLTVTAQIPIILHVLQIILRAIEVSVIVVISIEKLVNIEGSTHADTMAHHVRMLESKIHSVIPAETAAGYGQSRGLVPPAQVGKQFMQNVTLKLQVSQDPNPGMCRLVVPALGIDRVGTKYLQLPAVDFAGQNANHPAVFVLEKSSHGSRENQDWHTAMAEHQHLHVSMQFLAETLVIFAIHGPQYLT